MTLKYQEKQEVIVTVPILQGARLAAGMGKDRIEALENLVLWLAGAGTGFDLNFQFESEGNDIL
jgi:hypothetical protein